MRAVRRIARILPFMTVPATLWWKVALREQNNQQGEEDEFRIRLEDHMRFPIEQEDTRQVQGVKQEPESGYTKDQQKSAQEINEEEIKQEARQTNADEAQNAIISQETETSSVVTDEENDLSERYEEDLGEEAQRPQLVQSSPQSAQTQVIVAPQKRQLSQNTVIINSSLPRHIINHVKALGYQVIYDQEATIPLSLMNDKKHVLRVEQDLKNIPKILKLISNYHSPPRIIQTYEQAQRLVAAQDSKDFIVLAYVPSLEQYKNLPHFQPKSKYDTFTAAKSIDMAKQQQKFNELAYSSTTNRVNYYIVRGEALSYFKLNKFDIGVPTLITKSGVSDGQESNRQWGGQRFKAQPLKKVWTQNRDRNLLNHMAHHLLNYIDTPPELEDKITQMKESADTRKVLFVYSNEKDQFQSQLDEVLLKVAKIQKKNVIVIKTRNPELLRSLKIQPEGMATTRLIDLTKNQSSLFDGESRLEFYSRSKPRVPFQVERLCQFINGHWQEHYESKSGLTTVKPVMPESLNHLEDTLVLVEKEGCPGCQYMEQTFDELKKVQKGIASSPRAARNLSRRFVIQDPISLTRLRLRRYSIFNDSTDFDPPQVTPQAFYFHNGQYYNIRLDESLGIIKKVKVGEAEMVHDMILSDMIRKIKLAREELQE